MKKLFVSLLIVAALLSTATGCSEHPGQTDPDTSSGSGVLSSTAAMPSSSEESAPASDGAARWQDFVAKMERQGVTEGDLKTLENSGLPQTEIMEMTAQEILDRIEEIASVFTSNKMEVVRELLSDWGLAANDEQFVYVGQQGTLRLEQVEDLIAAVEREDSASIMGVMIGNPIPVVFELVQEPGEGLTLWKHTDVYGTGEVESAQATITTIDDCALFYQFTDADGVAFSFPKGSLQEVEAIENYIPGDDLPDAQVSAAQAVAAAEEIRPLHSGYAAWREENNLPKSSSPYGTRIPESYIEQAQTVADDGQRAEIEGAAMIAGKPFYEVYFYQDEQFGGNAYYIGANDARLIYNISMVDGMPIPVAAEALRTIRCAGTNKEAMDEPFDAGSLLETVNTEYLPLFGSLINCDDWNNAEEIPVYMFYSWYRDYINSVTTPEERIERYKLDSSPDSPGWAYPAEEFEDHIKRYFAVSTEYLRGNDEVYLPDKEVYWAGGGSNISYRIKAESDEDIQVDGDILTVRVAYSLLGDFSDTIYKELVMDISGGQVKFIRCAAV